MKPGVLIIGAVVALAVGATATFILLKSPEQKASSLELTVHFTCDSHGRLQPCGCFTGQHGGLGRLKTWMKEKSPQTQCLNLDVGGAIAGNKDYDIIQYDYMTQAFREMDYAALNMGGREATVSATQLRAMAAASSVPMISASLVDAQSGELLLDAYQIVERGELKIGILGVLSPTSTSAPGEGVRVLGLNEAINQQLPSLSEKSDLIILLAFASEEEMRRLARDYFEFSMILGGDVPSPSQEIIKENDSLILFTTNEARTVGTLSATIEKSDAVSLTEPSFSIDMLWERIEQDEKILALIEQYLDEIRNTELAIDDPEALDPDSIPGVKPTAHYVGTASCRDCHPKAYQVWKNSGHAHAFETLVKKGSDADPHCIACHTVGFGKHSGYRRAMTDNRLLDVGCESCHGPASEHIARYKHGEANSFQFRPLGPGDCKSCHYGEFSRPFVWESFWPAIKHGKESEMASP